MMFVCECNVTTSLQAHVALYHLFSDTYVANK